MKTILATIDGAFTGCSRKIMFLSKFTAINFLQVAIHCSANFSARLQRRVVPIGVAFFFIANGKSQKVGVNFLFRCRPSMCVV